MLTYAEENEDLDVRTNLIYKHKLRWWNCRKSNRRNSANRLPQMSTVSGKTKPHDLPALSNPSRSLPILFSNLRQTGQLICRCTLYRSTASTSHLPKRARMLRTSRELTGQWSLNRCWDSTCEDAATDLHVVGVSERPRQHDMLAFNSASTEDIYWISVRAKGIRSPCHFQL
jgi:hypothetical protein